MPCPRCGSQGTGSHRTRRSWEKSWQSCCSCGGARKAEKASSCPEAPGHIRRKGSQGHKRPQRTHAQLGEEEYGLRLRRFGSLNSLEPPARASKVNDTASSRKSNMVTNRHEPSRTLLEFRRPGPASEKSRSCMSCRTGFETRPHWLRRGNGTLRRTDSVLQRDMVDFHAPTRPPFSPPLAQSDTLLFFPSLRRLVNFIPVSTHSPLHIAVMSSLVGALHRNWLAQYPPVATKTEDAVKFGILGAANIAPMALITPAKSHPQVIVQAVAARDKHRAAQYAKKHGIPQALESYQGKHASSMACNGQASDGRPCSHLGRP